MSARAKRIQPDLFDAPRPAAPERAPPDLDFIRKHLNRVMRLVRNADFMPWPAGDAEHWQKFFPELTALLPPEEGKQLLEAFRTEIARIRAASATG
jgi:hypothetical protein